MLRCRGRKSRLLGGRWRRSRGGLEAGRHDGEVFGRWCRLSRGLFLEELLLGAGFDAPVVALARVILGSLNLDEVLVEAQVVANTILPTSVVGVIKRVVVANPLVDLGEGQTTHGRSQDGHANELRVAVGGFRAVIDDGRERVVGRQAHVFGPGLLVGARVLDGGGVQQSALSVCFLVVALYGHVNVGRSREDLRVDVFFAIAVQVKRRFLRARLEFGELGLLLKRVCGVSLYGGRRHGHHVELVALGRDLERGARRRRLCLVGREDGGAVGGRVEDDVGIGGAQGAASRPGDGRHGSVARHGGGAVKDVVLEYLKRLVGAEKTRRLGHGGQARSFLEKSCL